MPGCKRRKSITANHGLAIKSNRTNFNSIKVLKCIKFQQKILSDLSPADMPMTEVQPKGRSPENLRKHHP